MATMLVLLDREPPLGAGTTDRLARLGITRVAVLRDRGSSAVILEGWAFRGSPEAVLAALAAEGDARVLHCVAELSLSSAQAMGPHTGAPEEGDDHAQI